MTFVWKPTDPEGRRWELWESRSVDSYFTKPAPRTSVYHGRLLVLYAGNGSRKVSVGHFTSQACRSIHGKRPAATGWVDRVARTVPGGARALLLAARRQQPFKKKAPTPKP